MYTGLLHAHSSLRYVVLLMILIVLVMSFIGIVSKKHYKKNNRLPCMILLVVTHTQFLLGIMLYMMSPYVSFESGSMRDAYYRYWTIEHLLMMVIAVGLITTSRIVSKKANRSIDKFKRIFIFNFSALIVIIISIVLSGRGLI